MRVRVWGLVGASCFWAGCSASTGPGNDSLPISGTGFGGQLAAGAPGNGGFVTQGSGGFVLGAGGASTAGAPFGGVAGIAQGGAAGTPNGGATATGGAPAENICGAVFHDCNGNPGDGCETNTESDVANCGQCGTVCPPGANASPTCFVGKCSFSCAPHWGDCDGKADNGCEDDLTSDQKNCGLCGMDCKGSPCQNGGCQCASTSVTAQKVPLDIYVLFDQSLSMNDNVTGGTKWDVIKGALSTFVQNSGSNGISIGIGYFPLVVPNAPPPCLQDSDCGSYGPCQTDPAHALVCAKSDACLASNYTPDVPIAILPGVSSAIVNSLNAHSPGGFTPTYPALQGSYKYVEGWAQAHPNDKTILVLATDGDPTTCDANNNVNTIATGLVAPALAGTPKIMTFVIGVGSSLTSLNQIASSGGTQQAFIVDTAGADPGGQFLAAMKAIEGSVLLGCQYKIPAPPGGGATDFTKVNVRFTPNGGSPSLLKKVANPQACSTTDGGWYYDNPSTPTQIILCDSSCSAINSGTGATVEVVLGCASIG